MPSKLIVKLRYSSKRAAEFESLFYPSKKRQKTGENGPDASAVAACDSTVRDLVHHKQLKYNPPLRVVFHIQESNWIEKEPVDLFIKFLGQESLHALTNGTNARAARKMTIHGPDYPAIRRWHPTTVGEMLRWLGLLLFMGLHIEKKREEYWQLSTANGHGLGQHMGENRWSQIHRFLCINDNDIPPEATFIMKLEPLHSIIRKNCQDAMKPATWVAVDEGMASFQGRSFHTIKIKNKPIPQGFKFYAFASAGYIHDWLWHSSRDGTEECGRKGKNRKFTGVPEEGNVSLAPTFQVPIRLMERLRDRDSHTKYTLFLDNLFLNVKVAHVLLGMQIGCTGTTRKNADGVPTEQLRSKAINRGFKWGESTSTLNGKALCLLWQDNNDVLAVTTSFSIHRSWDRVKRFRRRPKPTSTNAAVVLPVFGDLVRKWLDIPDVIDAYNHHMNGVDRANQLRQSYTCHRPGESKWWRPLFFWLIDVCAVNAYLIWLSRMSEKEKSGKDLHRVFQRQLIESLLATDVDLPLYDRLDTHIIEHRKGFGYCAWGRKRPGECVSRGNTNRQVLGEVVNEAMPKSVRPRQVHDYCTKCHVYLCTKRDCWRRWHHYLIANPTN
jgi:hypothetical protein